MTRDQIKAELRRSAREDKYPFGDVMLRALTETFVFRDAGSEWLSDLAFDDCRTFFLLVAEAME